MTITYLFIPGSSEKKIMKGLTTSADTLIIDLEDAVLPKEKEMARLLVRRIIQKEKFDSKLYVRINSCQTEWWEDDIQTLCGFKKINGFMLPKSEKAEDIQRVAGYLNEEQELIPLIESARGLYNLNEIIKASKKIRRVAFGSVDYALDMNVDWTKEGKERTYAMNTICVQSRVCNIEPPIDAVFPILDDEEAFAADILVGKQTGFWGKMVIHPDQIESVKKTYEPSEEKILWSKKVIELYENNQNSGAVTLDGKLVDLPIYLLAKRVIGQLNVYS